MNTTKEFDTVLKETRLFKPLPEFSKNAHISSLKDYERIYKESIEHNESFWGNVAEELHWFKKWKNVLNTKEAPFYKWFEGGKTNIAYNALDRHLTTARKNKIALLWEGEPGDKKSFSYWQLTQEVKKCAHVLKYLGIQKGDRVIIYLPMIPELAICVLACARIGAVHSVIFAGFAADAIKDRIDDCKAKLVITADGGYRRGKVLPLKSTVDEAIKDSATIENVLVIKRKEDAVFPCTLQKNRDHWYHELYHKVSSEHEAEVMDSEDMLFLLYTSGTTGKPKGIMHTTGGYMTYAYLTSKYVFDLHDTDVFWCTADIGWVTGHSYLVYGPLLNGATVLMYEGTPQFPDEGRFWKLIEDYGVTIFYTAPTAIRTFMKWGDEWPKKYNLSSLRLLGTVGEPINPEAWMWYHRIIGNEKCPIVDTWWQTETGGIMLTPLPGAISTKPGSATLPFFGIEPAIYTNDGKETDAGYLVIKNPWPGMLRGIYGDPDRYIKTYWSKWNGIYFPGDGARKDTDGYYWILGRVDDVVNVSGHRIGTSELESIFIEHPAVAESAVIGAHHEVKGQSLIAFVSLRSGQQSTPKLEKELMNLIETKIGKFACPERIIFSADVPKTRSGKIMRRLLRDIAEGRALGNVTTLADPAVIETLKTQYNEE